MPNLGERVGRNWLRAEVLEVMAWCTLALFATVMHQPGERLPRLHDDSFQYLSAAQELRSEKRISTSLVHFDTERSHGTIPAPLTWFPPGYPVVMALVSKLGFSYERAALLISIASFVLVTAGLWRLVRVLDASRWAARVAVLCWLTNSHVLNSSASALSEPLFTMLGLASLLFLVNTDEASASARNSICWFGSSVTAGISYWVRYAGVLWVLTCVTALVAQIAAGKRNKPSLRSAFVAGGSAFLLLIPLMIRNVWLVGDWRGGNNTPAAVRLSDFSVDTGRLLLHLVLGDGTVSQLWFPMVLMSVGLIGICLSALESKAAWHPARVLPVPLWRLWVTKWWIVLAALLVYSIGIAAIALRSVISYSPRMYIPALPHAIALAACAFAYLIRRLARGSYLRVVTQAMVICLVAGYVAGNWISRTSFGPDAFEKTTRALAAPDETGRSMKQLLDGELKPRAVIAATNGQAAGYILRQPTLSLVGRPYTLVTWDEPTLRRELARFGVTHLLVFRDARLDPVIQDSQFLGALAEGQAPAWLRLAGMSREVCLYRVGSDQLRP